MTKEEAIKKYQSLGLAVEEGVDEPGKEYPPHKHETTYLFTVSGSISIKKEGEDWKTYTYGMESVVADGQEHQAKVGEEGWKFVAAWNEKEAEKYSA